MGKTVFNVIKKVFGTKFLLKLAVEELDLLEPFLADQFDKGKAALNSMDSKAKAKWAVDKIQEFLRLKLGLDEEAK